MKSTLLNTNWNIKEKGEIKLITSEFGIQLFFPLQTENVLYLNDDEEAIINFSEVFAYSTTEIDKEKYLNNQYHIKASELNWGNFVELKNSNWQKGKNVYLSPINDKLKPKNLKHFVFFGENEIVECIAEDYSFSFKTDPSESIEKKYPKAYFSYYLNMFFKHFTKADKESFRMFTELYTQMTNRKEIISLKEEITAIEKQKDEKLFLKLANQNPISNFEMKQLKEMMKYIKNYK